MIFVLLGNYDISLLKYELVRVYFIFFFIRILCMCNCNKIKIINVSVLINYYIVDNKFKYIKLWFENCILINDC